MKDRQNLLHTRQKEWRKNVRRKKERKKQGKKE